ncbi:hypothetical protein J6590_030858 [Homalodisca vitripennis]|nr:hypothetical protein J6590_030858 [Homalodisca vitripennis]
MALTPVCEEEVARVIQRLKSEKTSDANGIKVFEKLFYERLESFLEKFEILNPEQFGFFLNRQHDRVVSPAIFIDDDLLKENNSTKFFGNDSRQRTDLERSC